MTEGSSETVKIDVARQSIGFLNIGTENGSILSNIEVFRDTDHEGEGTSLVVDYTKEDETVDIFAKLNVAPGYIKQSLDAETGIITESEAVENVTDVTFVAYDPDTHTAKSSFDAEKQDDGSFWAQMSSKDILPGQEIYIRVTTDRSHGISSKTVRYDEDGNIISNTEDNTTYTGSTDGVTYSDVFTGFTVVQKGSKEIPVKQTLELPMDMNFTTLPLIGTTGINFDFPFVSVGSMKTSTGYRMYLGFNPTSLYDKISGDHATSYMSDSGNYFGDIFSIKHPINTFKEGLAQSYNTAFKGWENLKDTQDTLAAMGAPTWRMSFVFGVYFDFAMISTTNQQTGNTTSSGCDFTGVGGFIAVSAGFKVAWYTLLPVVFIPAYFGIEINGSVMGFFGAEVDYSKPKITYDKAKNATVDFGNSLSEFHSSVRMAATVQIYVGVGLAGTIGLRGGGTFTAMANWEPDAPYVENDWGLALIFTAGIWVDLFLFSVPLQYTFPMIKFGSFEEYDKLAKNGAQLQGLDGTEGARFAVRKAFTDESSVWLPEGNGAQLMSAFAQSSQQTIVENGYEHPDTQLIKLSDGSIFMAFLDNDASRGEIDRTILKYAVYKNGVWSAPKQVQNDATGDFQPSICEIDGGRVMAAWISTDPAERKDEDKEQTADYLRKLEVYTAVIDPNAGEEAVSGLTRLTDDYSYDYKPVCVYDDQTKDRTVYYSKNLDSEATTEEMSNPYGSGSLITYMLYSNEKNKWMFDEYYDEEVASEEDRQTLIANWGGQRFIQPRMNELGMQVVPNIADFTAIAYNGIAVYAYTVDVDSNADTIDDRELFVQFYNFSNHKTYVPVRLTNDSPMVADSIPQFARSGSGENANTRLFWYRDNKDIAYVNITELVKVGANEDGTIKDEYLLSKDEDASGRESKGLEALYSFVSPTNEHENDASGMADFKPVVDGENIYVVWTQPLTKEIGEEEYKHCREVYATALVQGGDDENDSEENTDTIGYSWSSPYKLTDNEVIASEPSAVVDQSGNLMVVYNTYEQTMNSQDSVFGVGAANKDIMTFSAPKLMASYQVPCGAVEVTDIRLSDETPMSGEKTEVTIDVTNTGLSYADGYTVDVYEYRNGSKGEKITTITSTERLIPDNTDTYTVEWTVPENAQEMSIYTEAHEAEFENISTFESEKIRHQAVYELSDAYVYQDNSGAFRLNASVKNTGNTAGAPDDKVRVTFVGPYAMNLKYSSEQCRLGDISLDSIPVYTETETDEGLSVTGQTTIDGDLVIPEGALEKYGYIDCIAQAFDKDGNELGQGADVRIVAQKPTGLMLNGDEIPEEITLGPGESLDLKVTGTPALLNESIDMTFVTDDTSVAFVNGDTLTANAPGETVLHGVVCPYSMELQDIRVKVLESTVEGIEVTYDKTSGEARLESSEAIENADLIFAEYDSDGKLLSAEVRTVTAAAKGAARTSYTVKSADNTLKVMLWDRVNGLKPYDFKYIEEVN